MPPSWGSALFVTVLCIEKYNLQSSFLVRTGQHPWREIPTDWDGPIVSRFLEKNAELSNL